MGLSHFPTASEGVLPVLVMHTVLSASYLKNMVRSMLQAFGSADGASATEEEVDGAYPEEHSRERRISITQFKSLCNSSATGDASDSTHASSSVLAVTMECCVCLSGFEAEQEVSELSCKHFFHKACLDKWFDNNHSTCPLCRSAD